MSNHTPYYPLPVLTPHVQSGDGAALTPHEMLASPTGSMSRSLSNFSSHEPETEAAAVEAAAIKAAETEAAAVEAAAIKAAAIKAAETEAAAVEATAVEAEPEPEPEAETEAAAVEAAAINAAAINAAAIKAAETEAAAVEATAVEAEPAEDEEDGEDEEKDDLIKEEEEKDKEYEISSTKKNEISNIIKNRHSNTSMLEDTSENIRDQYKTSMFKFDDSIFFPEPNKQSFIRQYTLNLDKMKTNSNKDDLVPQYIKTEEAAEFLYQYENMMIKLIQDLASVGVAIDNEIIIKISSRFNDIIKNKTISDSDNLTRDNHETALINYYSSLTAIGLGNSTEKTSFDSIIKPKLINTCHLLNQAKQMHENDYKSVWSERFNNTQEIKHDLNMHMDNDKLASATLANKISNGLDILMKSTGKAEQTGGQENIDTMRNSRNSLLKKSGGITRSRKKNGGRKTLSKR